MTKWHLTDEGPKKCEAKSPETCTVNPNGSHFEVFSQAQAKFDNLQREAGNEFAVMGGSQGIRVASAGGGVAVKERTVAVQKNASPAGSSAPAGNRPIPRPMPRLQAATPGPRQGIPRGPASRQADVATVDAIGAVPGPYYVFHKDIGFPENMPIDALRKLAVAPRDLLWSGHAISETRSAKGKLRSNNDYSAKQRGIEGDKYGAIERFTSFDATGAEVIEVKLNKSDGKISRVLYRLPADERGLQTCVVLQMNSPTVADIRASESRERKEGRARGSLRPRTTWMVVTAWLNEANDDHRSLDRSKYDTQETVGKFVRKKNGPSHRR